MSDWVGNRNSVYKTLGASNHTDKEREKDDYYATDPIAIDKLLTVERPNENVWECAALAQYIKQKYPDAKKLNYGDFPYAFVNNQNDTGPNLYIKPIAKQNTAGGLVIRKAGSYTGKRQD